MVTPAVQNVAPIDTAALLSPDQLLGARVLFRPYDSGILRHHVFEGVVTDCTQTRYGVQYRIAPLNQPNALTRWHFLNDMIGYVWYTPANEQAATVTMEIEKSA